MAKATKKQVLGRGLSAILNNKNTTSEYDAEPLKSNIGLVKEIPIEFIDVNPFQPRSNFKENSLKELASSIKELGVIQPITVRRISNNEFQLSQELGALKSIKNAQIKIYTCLY